MILKLNSDGFGTSEISYGEFSGIVTEKMKCNDKTSFVRWISYRRCNS